MQLKSLLAASLLAMLACVSFGARAAANSGDQCDPSAGVVFAPGEQISGVVMYEDLWPTNGDLDFNDEIVAWHYEFLLDASRKVVAIQATYNLLAVGADLHNGVYLHLPLLASTPATISNQDGAVLQPVAGETEMVLPLIADTRDDFPDLATTPQRFINTVPGQPVLESRPLLLTVTFPHGVELDTSEVPFDLFIARTSDYGFQIHLSQYPGTDQMDQRLFDTADDRSTAATHFINERGLPFALAVPEVIVWPAETRPLDELYPAVDDFGASGGTWARDWYTGSPTPDVSYTGTVNTPPPTYWLPYPDLSCDPDAPFLFYWQAFSCTVDQPCEVPAPGNWGGDALGYSVDPPLPDGLTLDPLDGSISGQADQIWPQVDYTVTAVNTGGSASATLTFAVNDVAPSSLSYPPDSAIVCPLDQPCTSQSPVWSGGAITHFSVSPALPNGLSMNPATGVITGTATARRAPGYDFWVTGSNSGGSTLSLISVAVE